MGSSERKAWIAAWTAMPLCLALGCGTAEDDAGEDGSRPDTVSAEVTVRGAPEEADTAAAAPASGPAMRAELVPLGGTDVMGTVSLSPGQGGTAVAVEIHGANSGLPYVAELVVGTCGSPGAVIVELGRVVPGESGDGEFREVVDAALLGAEQANRAVHVRGAGDATAIVACGDLSAASP